MIANQHGEWLAVVHGQAVLRAAGVCTRQGAGADPLPARHTRTYEIKPSVQHTLPRRRPQRMSCGCEGTYVEVAAVVLVDGFESIHD